MWRPVVADALGRGHRSDAVLPRTGGPAGNARLTAWLGLLTLVVVLAELVTLLDVSGLVRWHVGIGIALVALALLKTASTGWRIVRYYLGSPEYVEAGPPPLLLRLLGPFVVLSTLGVLGTGIALIAIGRQQSDRAMFSVLGQQVSPMTLHQATFIAFGVFVGLHVLARFVPASVLASGRPKLGAARQRVPGGPARFGLVLGGTVASVLAIVLVLPTVTGWSHHLFDRDDLHHARPAGHAHG